MLCDFNVYSGFPGDSVVKNLPTNAGDLGLISDLKGSSGEGNGNPLHYSCLGNPKDRGPWWATVHGVTKSWTWLSYWKTTTGYTMCWFDIFIYHKKIITWAAAYTFIILHNYYFLFCVISTFKIYCISNFQVSDTILLTMCSVVKLCLILYDAMDCSPPGSSVHGIFQAKLLECVAISFSIYKL